MHGMVSQFPGGTWGGGSARPSGLRAGLMPFPRCGPLWGLWLMLVGEDLPGQPPPASRRDHQAMRTLGELGGSVPALESAVSAEGPLVCGTEGVGAVPGVPGRP